VSSSAARVAAAKRYIWPAIVCLLTLTPVLGLFTRSKIFYIRDLSFFFWSKHLWLRHTLFSGTAPWWDPHVAAGQSAIADALNQILMPVTVAIRLLPSDVISFNLWVALPVPFAGLGMFCFLRRCREDAAAALGAIAFALSGVAVSMLNTPNLAWSVAATPWVLWGTERLVDSPSMRRLAALATIVALQALAGEPVTCAATCLVAIAFACVHAGSKDPAYSDRDPACVDERIDAEERRAGLQTRLSSIHTRGIAWTAAALFAGALLAAAQLAPTIMAGVRAHRGALPTPDFWSLHPLAALEVVAPHLFGNYYDAFLADIPWMTVLNSGRDPFFYSVYIGPLVLLVAAAGVVARPRRGAFWLTVAVLFALAAMGGYTPVYPFLRNLIHPLAYFRFPVKYLAISMCAFAVLAAEGWDALRDRDSAARLTRLATWTSVLAILLAVLVLIAVLAHQTSWSLAHALAARLKITNPRNAADFLIRIGPPLAGRAAGLLLAGGALLSVAVSDSSRARAAAYLLFGALTVDLAITNGDLNLTADVSKFAPPAWYTRLASSQRVYIGGRVRGFMNTKDPDAAQSWKVPAESTAIEGRMELNAELPMAPSAWRVREALSYDLPVLWPGEYEAVVRAFEHAGRQQRDAFLRRSGVRWCVLPKGSPGTPIVEVAHWEMQLVECTPSATRVYVTTAAEFGTDPNWQRAALFDAGSPDEVLRLASPPRVTGTPGPPAEPAAHILRDDASVVVVEASLPREGYVVLRDSFDPSWKVDVDETPAELARANGLHRAVRVPAGRHVIRFYYRPRDLDIGLTATAMTALVLLAGCVVSRRRSTPGAQRGFTLLELMIVMALLGIILAIAFARYHNMQAKGNEASAIASLRSIAAAEWSFAQTCGRQKYAPNLPALGQPAPATGDAFLSPDLTAADVVQKSGYQLQIAAKVLDDAPAACNGAQVSAGYAATADPMKPGTSGDRFFAVNADRTMYEDAQTFRETMPESGGPPHGSEVK
jgi:prepilin-type N-terminal cleavage/methylation domain-containing protein